MDAKYTYLRLAYLQKQWQDTWLNLIRSYTVLVQQYVATSHSYILTGYCIRAANSKTEFRAHEICYLVCRKTSIDILPPKPGGV